MSIRYAFVAQVEAKPETAEEVAQLLAGSLGLAQAEEGTVNWFAVRTSETTFWVMDTFETEDARQAHLTGELAAALMANAGELLARPPKIVPGDVLAAK
jgi:quinol monooxygenase YgiN